MPRRPRFAPPGYYLHLTQRGNYRQQTFFTDKDRTTFLNLLAHYANLAQVDILAYCLMPNHYHLLACGHAEHSIPRFMQGLNGRYSAYLNGRLTRTGRLWQTRYYSCLLEYGHLFSALRYVECNPVRAHLAPHAADYPWSSAPIHCHRRPAPPWLDLPTFQSLADPSDWPAILAADQPRTECNHLRRATISELPLASPTFLDTLEARFQRTLHASHPGRPAKSAFPALH